MLKNVVVLTVLLAVVCRAKIAEKISEDDDFVVYRIPVRALDLQPQETGYGGGIEEPSYGRSSSKTVSHSKSHSASTGTGKGRGLGAGSSGHGYGSGGGGGGGGGGGYQSHQPSYGSGPSYGGGGGPSYGGSSEGGHQFNSGPSYYRGGQGYGNGGGYVSGGYDGDSAYNSNTNQYDEEGGPKIFTTTKTYTTTNNNPNHHQQSSANPIGAINFRLSDFVKDAPGHELSTKFSQKFYEGGFGGSQDFVNSAPGHKILGHSDLGSSGSYRSEGPAFNVNEFTRSLNQGTGGFGGPSLFVPPGRHGSNHHNFGSYGSPSQVFPKAYALRHSGFGLNL